MQQKVMTWTNQHPWVGQCNVRMTFSNVSQGAGGARMLTPARTPMVYGQDVVVLGFVIFILGLSSDNSSTPRQVTQFLLS